MQNSTQNLDSRFHVRRYSEDHAESVYRSIVNNSKSGVWLTYFKKKDGSRRRMVFTYNPDQDQKSWHQSKGLLRVWDCEKGAWRFVNLFKMFEIKRIKSKLKVAEPTEAELDAWAETMSF